MATEDSSTSPHSGDLDASSSATQPPGKTSLSPCPQCRPKDAKNRRNIVVCIDGTSNQFGRKNTNVVKLFAKLDLQNGLEQHAYYSSGIGTTPKSLQGFKRNISDSLGLAIAWNLEEIVKDAYGWLARTYREGDQIYLFGFSRGAYQVRVLAGMIHEVGLIRAPTEKQIGSAYDHYEDIRLKKLTTRQIAREFKDTFSWPDLRVHFVGVWDTVSSVGLIREDVFMSTSSSAAHACHFRHALALDERRVKFMPEYFREINSRSDVKNCDLKEVWFAGYHSDVGGTNRPGKSHQAGNVSLLWMRREAAENGLVLKPVDIVWVPDDIDFGIHDSMNFGWGIVELLFIKHQTSFSGPGDNARRLHLRKPRRIIPGQKVHASILHANAYEPSASLGDGFDIPIMHVGTGDISPDDEIWETGLFDATAAQELLTHFGGQQRIAPVYLDRLLFLLRFEEGRQCVRNVENWETKFKDLIKHGETQLVKLVALVTYYEAAYGSENDEKGVTPIVDEFGEGDFDEAKKGLGTILSLAYHKHKNNPRMAGVLARVVGLLRPLTKHSILRERFLAPEVLDSLVELFDAIIRRSGRDFGHAMDGLNCLLQHKGTRETIMKKLRENFPEGQNPYRKVSRIVRILEVEETHFLTAALRMALTLARISRARLVRKPTVENTEAGKAAEKVDTDLWSPVKGRIKRLAERDVGQVGCLAVQILLVLYVGNDLSQLLNTCNLRVRANIARFLVPSNPKLMHHLGDTQDSDNPLEEPKQQMLRQLFGFNADELEGRHKKFIQELQTVIQYGNARGRTHATLTLLKLCESEIIRNHLLQTKLLDVFINQLQHKSSALLAAYALAICLRFGDMKNSIKNNELLPKHIVVMLRKDYFDDAVGEVEGFQVFGELMKDADLREKVKNYNPCSLRKKIKSYIPGLRNPNTEHVNQQENPESYDIIRVLKTKLRKGKQREIRTSLLCLDIFLAADPEGPLTGKLVEKSLEYLRSGVWKKQKAGVVILSALTQTENGVNTIKKRIPDIIRMFLPKDYLPIQEEASGNLASVCVINVQPSATAAPTNEGQTQYSATWTSTQFADAMSTTSPDTLHGPSSWMMGPACALRALAQNKDLREDTRKAQEYIDLKHLHLNEMLVSKKNTLPWRIKTPDRSDVGHMLDKMIEAVDGEMSEEDLMSIGDAMLPHIEHWDRLAKMLYTVALGLVLSPVTLLSIAALLGVSIVALFTLLVTIVAPVLLSPFLICVLPLFRLRRRPAGQNTTNTP